MACNGSPDMSPIGYAVNLHLDMAVANFGFQERRSPRNPWREMFPGCPYIKASRLRERKPGWGVEFDEKMAAEYLAIRRKRPGLRDAAAGREYAETVNERGG